RLADHQAAQLQQPRLHDHRELPAGEVAEVCRQVVALLEAGYRRVHRIARLVDRAHDDLREEPLLVREVLVDRLLRHRGARGDLVHARAEVSAREEQLGGRGEDRLALASRARAGGWAGRRLHKSRGEGYWTVQFRL